jgi:hypothetical protein
MKIAAVTTTVTGGALIALLDAYRAWAPGMKVKSKTPSLTHGVNFGQDRYIVKRRIVQIEDPDDRALWADEHGNCVCAWITKTTNINSEEPTTKVEAVVPLAFFDKVDITDLPIAFVGKKPSVTKHLPEL